MNSSTERYSVADLYWYSYSVDSYNALHKMTMNSSTERISVADLYWYS